MSLHSDIICTRNVSSGVTVATVPGLGHSICDERDYLVDVEDDDELGLWVVGPDFASGGDVGVVSDFIALQ